MLTVVYSGGIPRDVEGFPEGAARSVEGSLRLLPGQPREVTRDEHAHLVSIFGAKLRVIAEHRDPQPAPTAPVDPPARPPEASVRADESAAPTRRAGGSASRSTRTPRS